MESEQKLPTLEHLRAATVYEDESGYEVVNLPDGWALGCSDLLPLLIETVDRYEARAEALSEEIIKYEALNAEHVKRIAELEAALRGFCDSLRRREESKLITVNHDELMELIPTARALLAAGTKETH